MTKACFAIDWWLCQLQLKFIADWALEMALKVSHSRDWNATTTIYWQLLTWHEICSRNNEIHQLWQLSEFSCSAPAAQIFSFIPWNISTWMNCAYIHGFEGIKPHMLCVSEMFQQSFNECERVKKTLFLSKCSCHERILWVGEPAVVTELQSDENMWFYIRREDVEAQ